MFEEKISTFFNNVQIDKLRLTDVPLLIFFCGGDNHTETPETHVPSMRYLVLEKIKESDATLSRQIILAETFQDWLNQNVDITNLIDLEVLLAELATLVVLIVEGPGAYAELGAFSVIESIQTKLLPVVNTALIQERSFINFGPIDFLKNEKPDTPISELTWPVTLEFRENKIISSVDKSNESDLKLTIQIIYDDIKSALEKNTVYSPLLNTKQKGHVFLIIHEIIFLLKAAIIKEIKNTLNDHFSITLEVKDIKKYLYILSKLDFVEESKIKHNSNTYYFSKLNYSLFKYSYINKSMTRDVFKSDMLLYYYENDSRRQLAINNQSKGS
ncbi:retron St85 family effector protein [Vibrio parahaemolyticus]|uniref:retron St85 family effector protein n=1 Tax=Vibrio parahaemolyticus TaxID=670 RepID=UPI002361E109|nr:retron St85 family effector protein [Vibrio parahaemolyticus]EJG0778551.1 retron St85 family effector protein [Vibrio parahaemolyticus]